MMKEMSIIKRAQASQNQISPQNRNQNQNQNLRRNQPPNRPREDDQQITRPFHQNYVGEAEDTIEQIEEDDINILGVHNDDFEVHYDRKNKFFIHLMMKKEMIMKIVVNTWKMPSQNLKENMTLEAKLINKPPTTKPLKNIHKTALQPSLKWSNKRTKQWLSILIKVKEKALKTMKNRVQTLVVLTLQLVLL